MAGVLRGAPRALDAVRAGDEAHHLACVVVRIRIEVGRRDPAALEGGLEVGHRRRVLLDLRDEAPGRGAPRLDAQVRSDQVRTPHPAHVRLGLDLLAATERLDLALREEDARGLQALAPDRVDGQGLARLGPVHGDRAEAVEREAGSRAQLRALVGVDQRAVRGLHPRVHAGGQQSSSPSSTSTVTSSPRSSWKEGLPQVHAAVAMDPQDGPRPAAPGGVVHAVVGGVREQRPARVAAPGGQATRAGHEQPVITGADQRDQERGQRVHPVDAVVGLAAELDEASFRSGRARRKGRGAQVEGLHQRRSYTRTCSISKRCGPASAATGPPMPPPMARFRIRHWGSAKGHSRASAVLS